MHTIPRHTFWGNAVSKIVWYSLMKNYVFGPFCVIEKKMYRNIDLNMF